LALKSTMSRGSLVEIQLQPFLSFSFTWWQEINMILWQPVDWVLGGAC